MKEAIRDNILERKLKSIIQLGGPISVSTFMTVCMNDPEHGYYATRPKIGEDFCTAPEISQIFGELIGLWLVHEWHSMNCPSPFWLVELGPGRGTLLRDALRVSRKYPDYFEAAQLVLVETSPVLREIQSASLEEYAPRFTDSLDDLPSGPMLCIGNEFLDCLPARQFIISNEVCRERLVGLDGTGAFTLGVSTEESGISHDCTDGIFEVQEGIETLVKNLSERKDSFRILLIDYGTIDQAPSDSLRAYSLGQQADPFSNLGGSDLTVDVDFGRLVRLARKSAIEVYGPVSQQQFLLDLGVETRLDQLIKDNPERALTLEGGVRKLIDTSEMGEKFKVVCLLSDSQNDPIGFVRNVTEETDLCR